MFWPCRTCRSCRRCVVDDRHARHPRRAYAGRKDDGGEGEDPRGGLRRAVRDAAGWRAEAVLSVQGGPADLQRGTEGAGGCDDPMGERQLRLHPPHRRSASVNSSTPSLPHSSLPYSSTHPLTNTNTIPARESTGIFRTGGVPTDTSTSAPRRRPLCGTSSSRSAGRTAFATSG